MIKFTINNLIADLDNLSFVGGTSRSRDIYSVIQRGVYSMLSKIKPKELSITAPIENAVYDNVTKYTAPNNLNRKYILQISELSRGNNVDEFHHNLNLVSNRRIGQFRTCDKNMFTIEYNNGVKYLRTSDIGQTTFGRTIHTMNALTENGHWNTDGNIVNLTNDDLTFVSGNGSLRFDINNSANTGYIENFTLEPFSIEGSLKKGSVFTWIYLPNYNQIQKIKLTLASSLFDYYEISVNSPHNSNDFVTGWNLIKFDLNKAEKFGFENPNISRVRIEITSDGVSEIKDVRVDNIVLRDGTVFMLQYLSDNIFIETDTRLFIPKPKNVTDEIMLEYDTYMCLLYECAVQLVHDIYGPSESAEPLVAVKGLLKEQYENYKANNKDEFILEQQEMYSFNTEFDHEYPSL
jgi:hypothetical protein